MRRRETGPRRRATLRRKLVLGTSALIAIALIVTGAATVVALHSFTFERLDAQVLESLDQAAGPQGGAGQNPGGRAVDGQGAAGAGGGATPAPAEQSSGSGSASASGPASGSGSASDPGSGPASDPGSGSSPAPRIGSLQAVIAADGSAVSSSYTSDDGSEVELSDDQLSALAAAVPTERRPVTVD
ncbi:MAG: hypothetical protein QM606_07940, partial [Leucobacter sp.]